MFTYPRFGVFSALTNSHTISLGPWVGTSKTTSTLKPKKQQRPSKQYPWKMVGLPLAGAQAKWSIGPRSWQLSKFWNHCMSRIFFLCPSIIYYPCCPMLPYCDRFIFSQRFAEWSPRTMSSASESPRGPRLCSASGGSQYDDTIYLMLTS